MSPMDYLRVSADEHAHPTTGERKGLRRRFREAVLQVRPGYIDQAWDDDILTAEQYRWAQNLRRQQGLEP